MLYVVHGNGNIARLLIFLPFILIIRMIIVIMLKWNFWWWWMAHVHYSRAASAATAARGIFAFHAFSFAFRCDTLLASMRLCVWLMRLCMETSIQLHHKMCLHSFNKTAKKLVDDSAVEIGLGDQWTNEWSLQYYTCSRTHIIHARTNQIYIYFFYWFLAVLFVLYVLCCSHRLVLVCTLYNKYTLNNNSPMYWVHVSRAMLNVFACQRYVYCRHSNTSSFALSGIPCNKTSSLHSNWMNEMRKQN